MPKTTHRLTAIRASKPQKAGPPRRRCRSLSEGPSRAARSRGSSATCEPARRVIWASDRSLASIWPTPRVIGGRSAPAAAVRVRIRSRLRGKERNRLGSRQRQSDDVSGVRGGLHGFARAQLEERQASRAVAQHAQAYLYPSSGDVAVAAITTDMVLAGSQPIWHAMPETASRVRGRIEVVIDWAKARGVCTGENPARWRGHLANLLPKPSKVAPVQHHAALPFVELPAFMAELACSGGLTALALEFVILTARRERAKRWVRGGRSSIWRRRSGSYPLSA